jgi:hypothetical protein
MVKKFPAVDEAVIIQYTRIHKNSAQNYDNNTCNKKADRAIRELIENCVIANYVKVNATTKDNVFRCCFQIPRSYNKGLATVKLTLESTKNEFRDDGSFIVTRVLRANCDCPASANGVFCACHHIIAGLRLVQRFYLSRPEVTCTSLPREWDKRKGKNGIQEDGGFGNIPGSGMSGPVAATKFIGDSDKKTYRACNNEESNRISFALDTRKQIAEYLERKRNNEKWIKKEKKLKESYYTSFYKFYYDGGDDSDEEVEEVICALEYLELPANMFKKQERIVIEKLSPR